MSAKAKYEDIAFSYAPKDVTIVIRPDLAGVAYLTTGVMYTPYPDTRRRLHIFLHECAHFILHTTKKGAMPRHREEYEAETFAFTVMRRNRVVVPTLSIERAQRYVAHKIAQAIARGAQTIDYEAWQFIEHYQSSWFWVDYEGVHFGSKYAVLANVKRTENFDSIIREIA